MKVSYSLVDKAFKALRRVNNLRVICVALIK